MTPARQCDLVGDGARPLRRMSAQRSDHWPQWALGSAKSIDHGAVAGTADEFAAAGLRRAAFNFSEGLAAQAFTTPRGERLTLIVGLPRPTVPTLARRMTLSDPMRLAVILAVGGVLCFALARHLSTPLLRVARAANALAEGRLQTRIGGGVAILGFAAEGRNSAGVRIP